MIGALTRHFRQLWRVRELLDTKVAQTDIGRELAAFSLQEGVLIRPLGNVAYCLPPYCTTDDDLQQVYDVIQRFLEGERAAPLVTGGPIDD